VIQNYTKWVLIAVFSATLPVASSIAGSEKDAKSTLPTISAMRSSHVFKGRGDKCVVSPTSKMLRNHPAYILDQRDKTVYKGIRTKQFRLQNCVNCHADPKTNSVLGNNGFCQNCHTYTAVKIDCFSCHTDKRQEKDNKPAVMKEQ